ncbi:MAG: hypothetical protein IPJ19_17490 [Planctomycetes bacterium]|nr:hypothetical protein [Planctomycetota bacterium]
MKQLLQASALFLLSFPALAVQQRVQPASGPLLDPERVYMDEPGDAHVWARTESYKASFGAEGATFVPFLGSKAPHNYPLGFHVIGCEAGVAPSPSQIGAVERIEYERGGLIERYDLAPGWIEQSFVLRERPAAGDYTLRIGVESELAGRLEAGEILFSNELGGVRYGRATAIDALGRTADVPALLHEGEIELVVPGAFLADAQAPITIDPIVSTFTIGLVTTDDYATDTAYDLTTDHFVATLMLEFSLTDHDIVNRILSSTGTWLWAYFVDSSATDWRYPHVANNGGADQFLTVAQVGTVGSWNVYGRTATASNGTQGTTFLISGAEFGDKHSAQVGGDPNPSGTTYYCVVWTNEQAGNGDIHYQLIRPDGTKLFTLTQTLDGSTQDNGGPNISKSNGNPPTATQEWNVAWTRSLSSTNHDIYAAQIHRDGSITSPVFAVSTGSANDDIGACVSSLDDQASGTRNWMVAWTRRTAADWDTRGAVFNGSSFVTFQTNLAALEDNAGSGTLSLFQETAALECDGSKFTLTYAEYNSSQTSADSYVATFDLVANQIQVQEPHIMAQPDSLGGAITSERSGGGARGRCLMVGYTVPTGGAVDGFAALYDVPAFYRFCLPGTDVIACPCGNAPGSPTRGCNNSTGTGGAMIAASGLPAQDTVVLGASAMLPTSTCIFLQGSTISTNGVGFGDGVRCAAGTLKRLYVKTASSGFATAPNAGDPSIKTRSAALGDPLGIGTQRVYQIYYRDPQNFGCASPATFNITPALLIEW